VLMKCPSGHSRSSHLTIFILISAKSADQS
jgi:hypothetical protein